MAKSPEMKQTKNNTTSFEGDANASKIMKEVHQLYTKEKDGISNLGKSVSLAIHPPRRKINVLIIGNHSAGKSSFVNWYIGDEIQRTGVAIETQGFTFVTSGSKKTLAPIKGDSTVMLYPYLQPLKEKFGKALVENLSTCVSVSNLRHFSMVDFIDSPGLVDGDISYPFDVNEAILEFAEHADLIFVFLDPMGQALCSRTMKVVKMLNQKHFDNLKYYLTKADTVTNSTEMMKLMVQITQSIKENINNQHGLEIPAIWLPRQKSNGVPDEVNQIESVCETIQKSIHQKVQDNLSQVEADCQKVLKATAALLQKDELEKAAKRSREIVAIFFAVCAWTIPTIVFLTLVGEFEHLLPRAIHEADYVMSFIKTIYQSFQPLLFGAGEQIGLLSILKFCSISIGLFLLLDGLSKFTEARAKNFTTQSREVVAKWKRHRNIIEQVLERRQELFVEYVRNYTPAEDM